MLKSITADMKLNKNPLNNSTKKFHFYGGHDNSISSMMYALGNYNEVNPPYCAALIFELRKKGNKNFIVVSIFVERMQEIFIIIRKYLKETKVMRRIT